MTFQLRGSRLLEQPAANWRIASQETRSCCLDWTGFRHGWTWAAASLANWQAARLLPRSAHIPFCSSFDRPAKGVWTFCWSSCTRNERCQVYLNHMLHQLRTLHLSHTLCLLGTSCRTGMVSQNKMCQAGVSGWFGFGIEPGRACPWICAWHLSSLKHFVERRHPRTQQTFIQSHCTNCHKYCSTRVNRAAGDNLSLAELVHLEGL